VTRHRSYTRKPGSPPPLTHTDTSPWDAFPPTSDGPSSPAPL
jgi:hypothetical protein